MKLTKLKAFREFAPIALVIGFLLGCMAEKQIIMSDKQLSEALKLGMSRVDVEKLLGKPVLELSGKVYYGKPPKIKKWQSPSALASIVVVYSSNNVVQSRKFYGGN
jgi:hypothetical protein